MKGFTSYERILKDLLSKIVESDPLHAKWLNTLSYLENCGARKIASCEHPTLVREEMLKHAAEEFRHAHYLKKQIGRILINPIENYSLMNLIGGFASLNYLKVLDITTCRYLLNSGLNNRDIKETAYLLVTYAIELRADELYRNYDQILRKNHSKVTVMSILLEEKEHLNEMREGITKISNGFVHAEAICSIESSLCNKWLKFIDNDIHK